MCSKFQLEVVRMDIAAAKDRARWNKRMAKIDGSHHFWQNWSYWMLQLKHFRRRERLYIAKIEHEQEMEKLWGSKT